jgi:hypothetical protein
MGISARGGLYKPPYIYDSQTISKFTDPREVLIGGAQARLPGIVIVAEERLADLEQCGTPIEITQARLRLARAANAALKDIEDSLKTNSGAEQDRRNRRAFLNRRRKLLRSRLVEVLQVLVDSGVLVARPRP